MRALLGELAIAVAPFYLVHMLQRTLPAGFIAPCLPTKTDELPSGGQWLHEIKHDGFRVIARKDGPRVHDNVPAARGPRLDPRMRTLTAKAVSHPKSSLIVSSI